MIKKHFTRLLHIWKHKMQNKFFVILNSSIFNHSISYKVSLIKGIFPNHVHQGPTYLIFPSRADQEKWLYQLTLVSGGDPKAGTQFEQLVQKLMEEDGDTNSLIWRHSLMTHSKDPISSTLTTFTSETLQSEALKLFKSVQLFMSVVLDSSGIDYHVVLAQNAIQHCLDIVELQPELLSVLIKQTSRHAAQTRCE